MQEPPLQLPLEGALQQNYPNPFNPSTTFSFTIPVPAYVTLKVLDLLGREVATLVAESLPAGTWTRQWNAVDVAGGLYIYQIRAGAFAATRKLIVLH
ncbi:MAG TPA: T9SS type A sorting domain-containing protein [bacterium]|nr:T9SS type A sorting domain-containing protein [bacterium]HPR87745.1 T9SS type A sorting domain-containing protein [bacterium]